MRLTRLFEDLEDKDVFERDCYACITNPNISDSFHEDHLAAGIAAEQEKRASGIKWANRKELDRIWTSAFKREMNRLGYDSGDRPGIWIKKPLKEDLDDQDKFDCRWCEGFIHGPHPAAGVDNMAAFHAAHTAAELAAEKSSVPKNVTEIFMDAIARLGWTHINKRWVKKPLKEDLDDIDKFEPECSYCFGMLQSSEANGYNIDHDDFHRAHIESDLAARTLKPSGPNEFHTNKFKEMAKRGYETEPHYPPDIYTSLEWHYKPIISAQDIADRLE